MTSLCLPLLTASSSSITTHSTSHLPQGVAINPSTLLAVLSESLKLSQEVSHSTTDLTTQRLNHLRYKWQELHNLQDPLDDTDDTEDTSQTNEQGEVAWLIELFQAAFASQHVELVHSLGEPEYHPAQQDRAAQIAFAHGFFASALHEISHWCIAGQARRELADFGYWYAPDGRSEAQQREFESVEIKPQAIECLFTLACGRPFQVSQDNLFASFDTSTSTFAQDVRQQAIDYAKQPATLPRDARKLLALLMYLCQDTRPRADER